MRTLAVEGLDAVVLDIEGTTSATAFVYERLFPYSRERFAQLLIEREADPEVQRAREQIAVLIGVEAPTDDEVCAALNAWLDADEKVTPLKTLQGLIWDAGFAAGELQSHCFADVLPALRRWHAQGLPLYIYSSGSVTAQQAWFAHTEDGDVRSLFTGFFDTESAGPKRSADSYRRIAGAIGSPPTRLLFLSDVAAELDAAVDAGWRAVGVRRAGEPAETYGLGGHLEIGNFDELTVSR